MKRTFLLLSTALLLVACNTAKEPQASKGHLDTYTHFPSQYVPAMHIARTTGRPVWIFRYNSC